MGGKHRTGSQKFWGCATDTSCEHRQVAFLDSQPALFSMSLGVFACAPSLSSSVSTHVHQAELDCRERPWCSVRQLLTRRAGSRTGKVIMAGGDIYSSLLFPPGRRLAALTLTALNMLVPLLLSPGVPLELKSCWCLDYK